MEHNYTIYYPSDNMLNAFTSFYVPGQPGDPFLSGNTVVTDDWLCMDRSKATPTLLDGE